MSNNPLEASETISNNEVLIGGRLYDISGFQKVHPGGSVIRHYAGCDATDAFEGFHSRSEIAKDRLSNLRWRNYGGKLDPLLSDFRQLRKELEEEGYFEPSYLHISYRLTEMILFYILGWYLIIIGWHIIGALILSLGNGRSAWLMHECGHSSLTGNSKTDKLIQLIIFSLGNGGSGAFWNNQHNKHHASPQKMKHDVDLNTLPLVAFHVDIAKNTPKPLSKMTRLWLKYQAYFFTPIVTFFVVIVWTWFSHPRHMIRAKLKLEFLFWLGRVILILSYFTLPVFLINHCFTSMFTFFNFALSHTHKPVVGPEETRNWVEYAANYTTNIEPSWWCDWWMGYLNYQIEHHLFPSMPQFRCRNVATRVKKLFEKHGLQYDIRSYWEGVYTTFKNLDDVGHIAHEMEDYKKEKAEAS